MDKKVKAAWVKALRGGEYRQGRGALRKTFKSGDQYCALGVLCDVVKPDWWHQTAKNWYHAYGTDLPSLDLLELAGLTPTQRTHVIILNDDDKLPFTKIADWVEKNL